MLKYCYVPATSTAFSKGIFASFCAAATKNPNETNKAALCAYESIFLSWTVGQVGGWTNERTDRSTDGWTDGQTNNKWTDSWTHRQTDKHEFNNL